MDAPTVKYGDVVLGGSNTFDWEFSSGTAATERVFTITASRADILTPLIGKSATLSIEGPRKKLEVSNVYLLEIQPGGDPYTKRIRLADARWLWKRLYVASTFNLRRTNGNRFLAGEGRIENRLIQPDIQYAKYSLRDETTPWTALEALRYVIQDVFGLTLIEDNKLTEVELQDVEIDDSGDAAVDRLLTFLPGADIYLDSQGNVHIYDVFGGGETEILAKLPPLQRSGGWVGVSDRRALRPSKVVVLFTPEAEIRFDHQEPDDDVSQVRTEDTPSLYQVAPLPDATLEVDGVTIARSSWVELSKLFAAWGAFGIYNRTITFGDLRRFALKLGWASFEQAWGNNPSIPPDPVKIARAAIAAQSWRHTFRIDRYWVQRLAGIRPYRVAIVNQETGAYAPATVYSDWLRRPSYKGFAKTTDQNTNQGWAVRGYPDSGRLEDAEPAPARVDVVDEDSGVISVSPQVDPYGLTQAMILGYPEGGVLPSQDLGDANRTGQELYARWDQVVVEGSWKMSVVLTVVPGSPNTTARLYAVEIDPSQIDPSPGPCEGPVTYVRVFPGVQTARFAWQDLAGDEIKAAIKGEAPWNSDWLVNPDLIQDVALATARRIYDAFRDRPLGNAGFDMRPDIYPSGAVSSVRHTMNDGETTSSLTFSSVSQPADIWRYLSASSRKAILRVLNQGGS